MKAKNFFLFVLILCIHITRIKTNSIRSLGDEKLFKDNKMSSYNFQSDSSSTYFPDINSDSTTQPFSSEPSSSIPSSSVFTQIQQRNHLVANPAQAFQAQVYLLLK